MDWTFATGPQKQNQAPGNTPRPGAKKAGAKIAYEPTDSYEVRQIEGWTVLVNKGLLAKQVELGKKTLALLRQQLRQIGRRVPAEPAEKLRTIRIWVEENERHHPCMTCHPNPDWLQENGMNPDKARCVEVANAQNFLKWIEEQPWMVLHELAHGYHQQYLEGGFKNAEIKTAFKRAMKAKRYHSVQRSNGKNETAYAATNPMEYFAEASEAYFGTNDFYPFVRKELQRHDPEMYKLLKKLWHDP
jgi:hypothetical protein